MNDARKYGRKHIHKMICFCRTIEITDKQNRNQQIETRKHLRFNLLNFNKTSH